jgi:hypothetical protein
MHTSADLEFTRPIVSLRTLAFDQKTTLLPQTLDACRMYFDVGLGTFGLSSTLSATRTLARNGVRVRDADFAGVLQTTLGVFATPIPLAV